MKERKTEIRRDLIARDGRGCQAEHHSPDCSCIGCRKNECLYCPNIDIDHFTAKAVAKELGWTHRQVERLGNKQMLSKECHRDKDEFTPNMTQELRRQKRGRFIHFGEHAGLIYESKK